MSPPFRSALQEKQQRHLKREAEIKIGLKLLIKKLVAPYAKERVARLIGLNSSCKKRCCQGAYFLHGCYSLVKKICKN